VRRRVCLVPGLLWLVAALSVQAAEPPTGRTTIDRSEAERSALTPLERQRAATWELSAAEWQRYRALMDGLRGSVSPATLSPIEVLGIHARDDSERRRYAERWAVLMREDAERILAFQRAYDEAGKRLYPEELLIDPLRLPRAAPAPSALGATDRLLFFTRPACPACDALLERLLARLDTVAGLDIYLAEIPADDPQAVRDWAAGHGIDPEWVRSRRVTLNFAAGTLVRLAPNRTTLPFVMRRRGEVVSRLPEAAW